MVTKMRSLFVGFTLATYCLIATAGEFRTATLEISGMTCASCPLTVKQVLKKQPGVSEASVDYKSKIASVKFDPEKTQPEQLAKAVTDIGFPTTVKK